MSLKKIQGFSLLELSIAFSLTSLLFVVLIGSFFQIQELVSVGTNNTDRSHQGVLAMETLVQDLNNLFIEPILGKSTKKRNIRKIFWSKKRVEGSKEMNVITFASNRFYNNNLLLQNQVYNVTYYTRYDDEKEMFLLIRRENIFVDYENVTSGTPIVILDDIVKFQVEFSRDGEYWFSGWNVTSRSGFPEYIKITLEWKNTAGDGKEPFSLERTILPPVIWLNKK